MTTTAFGIPGPLYFANAFSVKPGEPSDLAAFEFSKKLRSFFGLFALEHFFNFFDFLSDFIRVFFLFFFLQHVWFAFVPFDVAGVRGFALAVGFLAGGFATATQDEDDRDCDHRENREV
jgi:hypothetical protein